ncbi:protein TIME FOR COFFEE isoform X2 [Herrania umbratica]|uniref:Protein TIME FOR COFFEE isoform X2 n=1 Tax=Herrania umbratica TaxID=108875 RepID=A0A6J0ZYJ9_9ROSI|nr:protein TIME FOR COFFEE isoform X2 [Herrania umbratica]
MERNRDARRSNLASSNGLPRRRQRSNNLRDSPEAGEMEVQETVRLRERASKRERDRDLLNRSKRRRADKVVLQGSNNREEGEESTEDSSGEEEDYETEQLSNRKISPSARVSRQVPPLKSTDEMISFPVPRKARSASVKRSLENWVAGNGVFVEEQNHGRSSISPARRSVESDRVSPSSSNGSFRKKMKPNGPKTRFPKATKSSSSAQEDIEIEIAEVLYGLMKQSQSSKKEDSAGNPFPKLESEDANGFSTETKPSGLSQIASSAQSQSQTTVLADPLVGVASKKKKVESENSPTPMKVENEQRAKIENFSPKRVQISVLNAVISESSFDTGKTASVLMESGENVVMIKQGDSKPSDEEEPNSIDGAVTREKSVSTEKESAKLDVDFQDSTVTKAVGYHRISTVSKVENQREEKFKIDLMAPPPMASSPERDGPVDIALDPKYKVLDMELIETVVKDEAKVVKKEMRAEDSKDKKMDTIGEKRDSLKLDLEKPHQDNGSDCCKFEHGKKQQLSKPGIPKVEKTAQSSSVPVPITLTGWPNGLPPLGYMPPFQTMPPTDGSTRSSTALQPSHFLLSQPWPKRCAMHHYIARNIHLHQQFAKMNQFWPSAPGSASPCGAKPNNLNVVPSAENLIFGNPLQGSFPVVNLNSTEEKGKVMASFPGLTRKDKSSDCTNLLDTAQRKQVVLQLASQPAAAGNLMHGPAFLFPLSQHQSAANQSGPSKCATSTNKASLSNNSTPGISTGSAALPGVAAAVSFNYPNLGANEAPYLTILQNNGYPLAVSAPVGNPSAIRGGTPTQALPFFNGSFYSSQMFHPQLQQQQAHSQPVVQPPYQNAVTSSGSSTSHKQPESNQPRGGQISGNNFLSSTSMQSQQLQKYHMLTSNQSRKLDPEMNGENTTSDTQKSVYGQKPPLPNQPLNYALVPSATVGGGSVNGNHSEKQLSQQKNLKGGVDLVPPQAFAVSFASFTGNNIPSNLNFSSMAQNPTIFHSLPEMARQGYQVAPVPQAAQQKNHQISDGKNGGGSTNLDDGKKVSLGKSHTTNGQTYVFDNPARSLNFASSPVAANWPPRSITSTTVTTNPPIAANSSNSQQQLLLLQKQHMVQQHQQQPVAASRSKSQTANTMPAAFVAAKFSSNAAIFPQTAPQSNSSAQSTQWKNSARTSAAQVACTSVAATNASAVKNLPQQPSRLPQGQTQISFGVNTKSSLSPQVQEIPISSQSASPMIVGSPPSSGNLRTSSTGSKVGSSVPTIQSQQSENSSPGNGQKSSPVCGRNVPSILSTCPSHLSELKY